MPSPGGVYVRDQPSLLGKNLFTQLQGVHGTVVDGPQEQNGHAWWKIQWDSEPPLSPNPPFPAPNNPEWSAANLISAQPVVPDVPKVDLKSAYYAPVNNDNSQSSNIYVQAGWAPTSSPRAPGYDPNSLGNCTWYVYGRMLELGYDKTQLNQVSGNGKSAYTWWDNAKSKILPDVYPKVGDIAHKDVDKSGNPDTSHVAVVEWVSDPTQHTMIVSESVYGTRIGSGYNVFWRRRTTDTSEFNEYIPLAKARHIEANQTIASSTKAPSGVGARVTTPSENQIGQPQASGLKNPGLPKLSWPIAAPAQRTIAEPYGNYSRGGSRSWRYATGMTISSGALTAVDTAGDGSLVKYIKSGTGRDHGYGNVLVISHPGGLYTLYGGIGKLEPELQDQIVAHCRSSDQVAFECDAGEVPVRSGRQLGSVGELGLGKRHVTGLRFEVRTFAGLSAPGVHPPEFGYSSSIPDALGYRNPVEYLEQAAAITHPAMVSVTASGAGNSLRIGPSAQYSSLVAVKEHETYWARMTSPATPGCSMGWYEIYRGSADDPAYPPGTPLAYIAGQDFQVPTAWACRGDGGEHWLNAANVH
jgi:murein DD-endopeptidase MepM/ murein hydrolase activator NlpD